MWDCDYHLCRARFPAFSFREPVQMPLIAEGDAPYTADREKVKSKSLFSVSHNPTVFCKDGSARCAVDIPTGDMLVTKCCKNAREGI
jgi:hypothetical protein